MDETASATPNRREITAEPLAALARFSFDWAPVLCDPADGCRAYHQGWSMVRLLESGGAPPAGEPFFTRALRQQAAGRKSLRVLLSASADTGLTGIVLRALRPAGIEPQIVLIDRCETTLQQNRLFAQAADFELETHRGDILDLRCAPADAILSHSFFSFVPRLDRPALARSWAELLVPGGVVLASQRITAPGKEKPFPMRAPDVSDRLARLGASARAAGYSETQAGDICQAGAALWAMHKRGNQSHEDELRGLFADAGIPVEAFDYGAAEPSVSPFPMPKEAVKNPRAEIVCRKSARAG